MLKFRNLKAEEIEARVAQVGDGWVQLLLYKDARCDMRILDETVGPERWTRSHEVINGNLFCNVSIRIGTEWVTKQDVGTESNTEKQKGEASDSFKRACVNWGIGRELYTSPTIFINTKTKQVNGRWQLENKRERYKVTDIQTTDGRITFLQISDQNNKILFTSGKKQEVKDNAQLK